MLVDLTGTTSIVANGDSSFGWIFQVLPSTTLAVNGLAYYNPTMTASAHPMQIYSCSSAPDFTLGSVSCNTPLVPTSENTVFGNSSVPWAVGNLLPTISLGPGYYAVMVELFTNDALLSSASSVTTVAGVNFLGGAFSNAGGDVSAPGMLMDGNNYFGPNLLVDASRTGTGSTPEPGTWLAMLTGLGVVAEGVRRRKNATRP